MPAADVEENNDGNDLAEEGDSEDDDWEEDEDEDEEDDVETLSRCCAGGEVKDRGLVGAGA